MSDTVQSYFDTGLAFLNRRQDSPVIADETEQKRLFGIFCRTSKSENQTLELMYRYFKCMNNLAGRNARNNQILLSISELYLDNETIIGNDLEGFCEEYYNIFKNSKKPMEELKLDIQKYFKQNGYNGLKRKDTIPVNGEIGKIRKLLSDAKIEYNMDEVLSSFASENTMSLNLESIPIQIREKDIYKLDSIMNTNGYKKVSKKTSNMNYRIPGTNTLIEFSLMNKELENSQNILDMTKQMPIEHIPEEVVEVVELPKEEMSRKLKLASKSGFLSLQAFFITAGVIGIGLLIANLILIK